MRRLEHKLWGKVTWQKSIDSQITGVIVPYSFFFPSQTVAAVLDLVRPRMWYPDLTRARTAVPRRASKRRYLVAP